MDKRQLRRILPLLQKMPILIMENVLKFSINKHNFKSIRAEVAAKSTNNCGKEALLHIIKRITDSNEFIDSENYMILKELEIKVFSTSYICLKDLDRTPPRQDGLERSTHLFVIICSFWSLHKKLRTHQELRGIGDIVALAAEKRETPLSHIETVSFAITYNQPIFPTRGPTEHLPQALRPTEFTIRLIAINYTLLPLIDHKYLHSPIIDCIVYGVDDHTYLDCRCPYVNRHNNPNDNMTTTHFHRMIYGVTDMESLD
jgi:hypothetical protein